MTYPADVQAALDYAAVEGWTTERYQAVLAIALAHLVAEPPLEEPFIQWSEEEVLHLGWNGRDGVLAAAGSIYLACPDCGPVGLWSVATDGTEYARFSPEDLARGEGSDFTGDADYFLCGACGVRFAVPMWLWEAGWFDWDKVEWGNLVTD